LVASYQQAAREIGRTVGSRRDAARVLVLGDSTSLNLTAGLAEYGRRHGNLVVEWAGHIGCPVVRVARYRMVNDATPYEMRCPLVADVWAGRAREFRPDLVLVVTSYMDASEMQRIAGGPWERLGEPAYNEYVLSEMESIVKGAASIGARLAWATAPRAEGNGPAATAHLNERSAVLNELIATMHKRHPRLVVVPLAERLPGTVDRTARPDGVHFTIGAAQAVADDWFGRFVTEAARTRKR
jgi:hypothetical protein